MPSTLGPGTRLGIYEVQSALGAGGMGEVYRAHDTRLGRDVALKILPPGFASDPERIARFHREAQVLASLNHPNIGAIYGFEESGVTNALILELVDGPTLDERLARAPVSLPEALAIASQIAAGLEAAHAAGVIHRDLKPSNVKVTPGGVVKILDFGLAKIAEQDKGQQDLAATVTAATTQGTVVGTIAYMSPEQARGKTVDARSDVWAFGCVLFEMLTGRQAFPGPTFSDTIAQIIQGTPEWRLLPRSTPKVIERLLVRCLAKDPSARIAAVGDIRAEIERARSARQPLRTAAVAGALAAAVALTSYWMVPRTTTTSAPRGTITLVIADFNNETGDHELTRTIEPLLRTALEDASFVTALDIAQIRSRLGMRPPERFDVAAAREVAIAHGLQMVVGGSIRREADGYRISASVLRHPEDLNEMPAAENAADKEQLPGAVAKLSLQIRQIFGDTTVDRMTTTVGKYPSFDAVREFALASHQMGAGNFAEALQSFARATTLDPEFGLAYTGMAQASRNLDRRADSEKYIADALRHLDTMTERERYKTRGMHYYIKGDYQSCVREYSDLLAHFPGEIIARNNYALCLSNLRNFPRAIDEMKQLTQMLPKRTLYKQNLLLYAAYAGDFNTVERERSGLTTPELFSELAAAFSKILQDRLAEAKATYEQMAGLGGPAASYSASGLGDLAAVEGRFKDAVRILSVGAAEDLAARESDRAAYKFAAWAHAELERANRTAAVATAHRALSASRSVPIRFLAAHIFARAGAGKEAEGIASGLAAESELEPRAHAELIRAEIAIMNGQSQTAVTLAESANALLDTWIGHLVLADAYLQSGLLTKADSELDRCAARRGEALSLFLDEEPTFAYLPRMYYLQGVVRERLKTERFADAYRKYMELRGRAGEDPLISEISRRVTQ